MSKAPENTEQLQTINQKILATGESLPVVQLKDGSRVQTGTVATMPHNIALYNAGSRGDVERELELCVHAYESRIIRSLFAGGMD